ncbi:hypothetical protein [Chamaesiphon sp. GL140_3_metabinner_50]|uniref:hypothetical protein n=1 Tax=Chamaesiphon sp. GL140_3_metabinner_50 TaxID=2970812 RepID=UPI0025E66666|nr:hypothetical protein [Chamaesiphon sp. GL140_3_metabinner_50]
MNTINSSPLEDIDLSIETSVTELQRQLSESLDRLSPERLHVLADFAAYLVDIESEAATQELLAIPGLLERVKQSKSIPKAHSKNWREIRSDV